MKNNKIIQPILDKMQDIILEIFEMLYEGHSLDKCVDSYTKQMYEFHIAKYITRLSNIPGRKRKTYKAELTQLGKLMLNIDGTRY